MDRVSDTAFQLHITKVRVSKSKTVIDFEYSAGDQSRRVGVHPPGAEGAFEIETLDGAENFALQNIEGIAVLPDRTQVMAGSNLKFKLTFDPIPKTLRRFNVGEGDYDPATGETSWYFKDVDLN
jgi:hypothetical protein